MVTHAIHQKPTYSTINGRAKKTYINAPRPNIRGKFKAPAPSSDAVENGLTLVSKKPTFQTWYKADLASGDRLIIGGTAYEIEGDPENVEGRGRYHVCVLKAIKGGA